jgi:hypothetical protein
VKETLNKQGWHAFLLAMLLVAAKFSFQSLGADDGYLWGKSTEFWFWLTIFIPVLHQVIVGIGWRAQLHLRWMTNLFGEHALKVFAAFFFPLFIGRVISLAILGVSNTNSLFIPSAIRILLVIGFSVPAIYLGYSVVKYFGLKRALGADHFDPAYRGLPLVKEGIFKYTNNGMYVFGFFLLWAIAFGFASKAALIAAAFNHLYIWVHFYTIEKPDMETIYG